MPLALIGLGLGALVRHAAAGVSLVFGTLIGLPRPVFTPASCRDRALHALRDRPELLIAVKPVAGAIGPWKGLR